MAGSYPDDDYHTILAYLIKYPSQFKRVLQSKSRSEYTQIFGKTPTPARVTAVTHLLQRMEALYVSAMNSIDLDPEQPIPSTFPISKLQSVLSTCPHLREWNKAVMLSNESESSPVSKAISSIKMTADPQPIDRNQDQEKSSFSSPPCLEVPTSIENAAISQRLLDTEVSSRFRTINGPVSTNEHPTPAATSVELPLSGTPIANFYPVNETRQPLPYIFGDNRGPTPVFTVKDQLHGLQDPEGTQTQPEPCPSEFKSSATDSLHMHGNHALSHYYPSTQEQPASNMALVPALTSPKPLEVQYINLTEETDDASDPPIPASNSETAKALSTITSTSQASFTSKGPQVLNEQSSVSRHNFPAHVNAETFSSHPSPLSTKNQENVQIASESYPQLAGTPIHQSKASSVTSSQLATDEHDSKPRPQKFQPIKSRKQTRRTSSSSSSESEDASEPYKPNSAFKVSRKIRNTRSQAAASKNNISEVSSGDNQSGHEDDDKRPEYDTRRVASIPPLTSKPRSKTGPTRSKGRKRVVDELEENVVDEAGAPKVKYFAAPVVLYEMQRLRTELEKSIEKAEKTVKRVKPLQRLGDLSAFEETANARLNKLDSSLARMFQARGQEYDNFIHEMSEKQKEIDELTQQQEAMKSQIAEMQEHMRAVQERLNVGSDSRPDLVGDPEIFGSLYQIAVDSVLKTAPSKRRTDDVKFLTTLNYKLRKYKITKGAN